MGLFIGAAIGSFLNALIYRMPRGLKISEPKNSFCPVCKSRLTILDLFPLLSWLLLRGRCRHCKAPIAARYFFVELITGSIFAFFWWQYMVAGWDPWRMACLDLFAAALVTATFIDLRFYIIPDQVNAFMFIIGIIYNIGLYVSHDPRATQYGMPAALVGAFTGWAVLWGITLLGRLLFGKDAMGHGDIKMARGIGAMLFAAAALKSFALSIVFGSLFGVVAIIARKFIPEPEAEAEEGEDEMWEPESIGSLLKCGFGYLTCLDIVGLCAPKFAEKYFGENPYSVEEVNEEETVPLTMIPFGPSLALGALAAVMFEPTLNRWIDAYLKYMTGGT